jgi:release factor glutamine methyltransferase
LTLVERRAAHQPYEYITESVSFYDIELEVAPGALIPRPETELLIDRAAELIERNGVTRIAEIGIGSGAISIVLARRFAHLRIVATDISREALIVAQRNIEAFGLTERIALHRCDLLEGIETPIEMIISNPPYIANGEQLEKNVVEFEPHTALFGGERGDELLRRIIHQAHGRGVRWLVCEMGWDQRDAIQAYVNEIGVEYIDFYRDLAGLDRGFVLAFPPKY